MAVHIFADMNPIFDYQLLKFGSIYRVEIFSNVRTFEKYVCVHIVYNKQKFTTEQN